MTEQDQKEQAEKQQYAYQFQTSCPTPPELTRQTLRENISNRIYHAQVASSKLDNLKELDYLLDRNPEVARIISLLELLKEE